LLCELDYGSVTGSTLEELRATDASLAWRWQQQPWQVRFATRHGALADLATAVRRLLPGPPESCVPTLCITHGHVIRAALTVSGQQTPESFWKADVPAGSFWHLQHAGHLTRTAP
jgi:broad specificity phosphatase PhoE